MGCQIETKKNTIHVMHVHVYYEQSIKDTYCATMYKNNSKDQYLTCQKCTNILKSFNDLAVDQQMWQELITFSPKTTLFTLIHD